MLDSESKVDRQQVNSLARIEQNLSNLAKDLDLNDTSSSYELSRHGNEIVIAVSDFNILPSRHKSTYNCMEQRSSQGLDGGSCRFLNTKPEAAAAASTSRHYASNHSNTKYQTLEPVAK